MSLDVATRRQPAGPATARVTTHLMSSRVAVGWLVAGAALTAAVSLVGTDVIGLHHDLYYLIYFTVSLGFVAAFLGRSGIAWRPFLARHWRWSVAVGVLVAIAIVRQVMGQAGTAHPRGAYFIFELMWRGMVYGAVDAITLYAFPALVAYLVLRGDRSGARRKLAFAGLTLVFSLLVSTTYHLGYTTYRGSELAKPSIGTVTMGLPTLLTGNPLGAVVAHTAVHTTAVVHQYYGGDNHFLPPELDSTYPERAGGLAGAAIAAGWIAILGAVVVLNKRRIQRLVTLDT